MDARDGVSQLKDPNAAGWWALFPVFMAVAHQMMKTRAIKTAYLTSASSQQATGKISLKVKRSRSAIQRLRPTASKHSGGTHLSAMMQKSRQGGTFV